MIGKVEGKGELHHGHVTAVTVAPEYRNLGLASAFMDGLENISASTFLFIYLYNYFSPSHNAYFVDLFARKSNYAAINMYTKLGYAIYRTIIDYYSGEEDGLDMRKSLPLDKDKHLMQPTGKAITPEELEEW